MHISSFKHVQTWSQTLTNHTVSAFMTHPIDLHVGVHLMNFWHVLMNLNELFINDPVSSSEGTARVLFFLVTRSWRVLSSGVNCAVLAVGGNLCRTIMRREERLWASLSVIWSHSAAATLVQPCCCVLCVNALAWVKSGCVVEAAWRDQVLGGVFNQQVFQLQDFPANLTFWITFDRKNSWETSAEREDALVPVLSPQMHLLCFLFSFHVPQTGTQKVVMVIRFGFSLCWVPRVPSFTGRRARRPPSSGLFPAKYIRLWWWLTHRWTPALALRGSSCVCTGKSLCSSDS